MTNESLKDVAVSLPEYDENPFIAKLPPIVSQRKMASELTALPHFDPKERAYSAQLRKHCLMRLRRFFHPIGREIHLAERFDIILRQGYVGRNPNDQSFIRHLQAGAERVEAKSFAANIQQLLTNTAGSFALIGSSGIGKTTSINQILRRYPQCIEHDDPFSLIQVVWLKIECPSQGGLKQLCINFFTAMDALLGTNYLKQYGRKSESVDVMVTRMALVAQLHALGVIVIDEVQHLTISGVSHEALLNFFVTLVNTVGVPVVLIGTPRALSILQQNFRQARRACGFGSQIWDRMDQGEVWSHFMRALWTYQWTKEPTELTPDIENEFYKQTQGITDVAINLFILAQMRAITLGVVRGREEPALTADYLSTIAKEELRIIEPMLSALRNNNTQALLKYDDLKPFQLHVAQQLGAVIHATHQAEFPIPPIDLTPQVSAHEENPILSALRALGVAEDVATVLIAEAKKEDPDGDPMVLVSAVIARLNTQPVKPNKPKRVKKKSEELPDDDLRQIAKRAAENKRSVYESLDDAGSVWRAADDTGA